MTFERHPTHPLWVKKECDCCEEMFWASDSRRNCEKCSRDSINLYAGGSDNDVGAKADIQYHGGRFASAEW